MTGNIQFKDVWSGALGRARAVQLDSVLLCTVGTLAAHQVAYSLAPLLGQRSLVGHGHLGLVWKLSLLAAVVGMAGFVLRSVRSRNHTINNPIVTGATIATLFAAMEAIERTAEGMTPTVLLTELVFWLGLVATIPITAVYSYVLRSVSEVAGKLWTNQQATVWPSVPDSTSLYSIQMGFSQLLLSWCLWGRGPPMSNSQLSH